MKIYKNCEGEKIDSCFHCKFIDIYMVDETTYARCMEEQSDLYYIYGFPKWCPLEDYKNGSK